MSQSSLKYPEAVFSYKTIVDRSNDLGKLIWIFKDHLLKENETYITISMKNML